MTVKVIYSIDKLRKCVIEKTEKNFFTYYFEKYEKYDEEELKYFPSHTSDGYWTPTFEAYHKPVFDNLDDLMKELIYEPEYKAYFIDEE